MKDLHIVFRKDRICIVKQQDDDWRKLQTRFHDFKASLGPWSKDEVADYWSLDYGSDESKWPFRREEIEAFVKSDTDILNERIPQTK
jgi:hypothetical protein